MGGALNHCRFAKEPPMSKSTNGGCGHFLGRSCDQAKAFAVLHGALPAQ